MFNLQTWNNWQLTAAQRAFLLATKEPVEPHTGKPKKRKQPVKRLTRKEMAELTARNKRWEKTPDGITAA